MSYVKKNVNMLLLLLVLLVAATLVGLTIYYQTTYESLSDDYVETVDKVNELSRNLSLQKLALNNTLSDLQLTSKDKQKLDSLYSTIADENDRLQGELGATLAQLKQAQTELTSARSELTATKNALASAQDEIADLESDIDGFKDTIDDLEEELCQYDATYC